MPNYRVRVETNDGCVTVWFEKSSAKTACKLITNRVYNQLCGLNIKEVSVTPFCLMTDEEYMQQVIKEFGRIDDDPDLIDDFFDFINLEEDLIDE